MYNRYIPQGEFLPVEEPPRNTPSAASPAPENGGSASGGLLGKLLGGGLGGGLGGVSNALSGLTGGLKGLLDGLGLGKLDKGDILLLFVLIYLFQDSEDDEWLIILALVLLMGL